MKQLAHYSGHIVPQNVYIHTKTNNVFISEFAGVRESELYGTPKNDFPYYENEQVQQRKMTLLSEVRAATMVGI